VDLKGTVCVDMNLVPLALCNLNSIFPNRKSGAPDSFLLYHSNGAAVEHDGNGTSIVVLLLQFGEQWCNTIIMLCIIF
jgi:hypothetical protein